MGGRVTRERVVLHCTLSFSEWAPGERDRRVSSTEEIRGRGEGWVNLRVRLEGSRGTSGVGRLGGRRIRSASRVEVL